MSQCQLFKINTILIDILLVAPAVLRNKTRGNKTDEFPVAWQTIAFCLRVESGVAARKHPQQVYYIFHIPGTLFCFIISDDHLPQT